MEAVFQPTQNGSFSAHNWGKHIVWHPTIKNLRNSEIRTVFVCYKDIPSVVHSAQNTDFFLMRFSAHNWGSFSAHKGGKHIVWQPTVTKLWNSEIRTVLVCYRDVASVVHIAQNTGVFSNAIFSPQTGQFFSPQMGQFTPAKRAAFTPQMGHVSARKRWSFQSTNSLELSPPTGRLSALNRDKFQARIGSIFRPHSGFRV